MSARAVCACELPPSLCESARLPRAQAVYMRASYTVVSGVVTNGRGMTCLPDMYTLYTRRAAPEPEPTPTKLATKLTI